MDEIAIQRTLLCAPRPVAGKWVHRDEFRILPPPPGAPSPGAVTGPHPFVLEFAFRRHLAEPSSNWQVRAHEIALLLAGLVSRSIGELLTPRSRHHWILNPENAELPPVYAQEGYFLMGFRGVEQTYTNSDSVPDLPVISTDEHYRYWRGLPDDTIEIPQSLGRSLDRYASLKEAEREQFLRACHWFRQSYEMRSYSMSTALIALVVAIETLAPRVTRGFTKNFIDFAESLVTPQVPEQDRRKMYRVRSEYIHGSRLMPDDLQPFAARGVDDDVYTLAWRIGRIVLFNWLEGHPLASLG